MRRLGPRLEDQKDLVQQDERGPERDAHDERRPQGCAVASSEGVPKRMLARLCQTMTPASRTGLNPAGMPILAVLVAMKARFPEIQGQSAGRR